MTQNNRQKAADPDKKKRTGKGIGHWARVGVMFISGGFIFPHAMTEGYDAKLDADQGTKKKVL